MQLGLEIEHLAAMGQGAAAAGTGHYIGAMDVDVGSGEAKAAACLAYLARLPLPHAQRRGWNSRSQAPQGVPWPLGAQPCRQRWRLCCPRHARCT